MGSSFLQRLVDPLSIWGIRGDKDAAGKRQVAEDEYQREKSAADLEGWLDTYLGAITDDDFNTKLLGAEEKYRSQWTDLGLADYEQNIFGSEGQAGQLDILERMSPRMGEMYNDAMSLQREGDIEDVEALGGRATAALRASDPEMQKLLGEQGSIVDELFGRARGVTGQQGRMAQQSAREAYGARGMQNSNSSMYGEAFNREGMLASNRSDYLNAAGQRFGMLKATAADPFQAILGRSGQAVGAAQNQQAYGQQGQSQNMGPAIFDPNAGINLGLGQQSNLMNYNAALYGADAQEKAGIAQGLGSMAGAAVGAGGIITLI